MTRKHYRKLAEALGEVWATLELGHTIRIEGLLNTIRDALQSDNPRFDRAKFLNAVLDAKEAYKTNPIVK